MERKGLVLVFPPLSVPTSPPLVMAALKALLEQDLDPTGIAGAHCRKDEAIEAAELDIS